MKIKSKHKFLDKYNMPELVKKKKDGRKKGKKKGGRDYGTGRLSGSGGRRMDTGERAGRTGGAAGREGARHREREDGDDWKARDRWTVRQDGEDRWTDTEGRSWMGTKGRGEQTRDMISGGRGRVGSG